jgi:hypothetical protein
MILKYDIKIKYNYNIRATQTVNNTGQARLFVCREAHLNIKYMYKNILNK